MKIIIPILFLFLFLSGCINQYEDGPNFSLISNRSKLIGTWEYQLDLEQTNGFIYTLEYDFQKNGNLIITIIIEGETYDLTSNWELDNEGDLIIDYIENNIVRLTRTEMIWLDDNGERIHFLKQ